MDATTDNSSPKKIEDQNPIEQLSKRIDELVEKIGEKKQEDKNFSTSVENIAKAVGAVATAVVALGFVFYILGYQIVNDHYITYGYRVFDLNRPVYLSAGVVFVISFLLPIIASLVFTVILARTFEEELHRRIFHFLALFFLPLVYLWIKDLLLSILTDGKLGASLKCIVDLSLFTEVPGCSHYVRFHIVLAFLILWTYLFGKVYGISFGRAYFGGVLLLLLLVGLYSIDRWGKDVYPKIVSAYAGGETSRIQLGIIQDAQEAQFLALNIEVTNHVTEELVLLDQEADFITVINKSCDSVKISKALITHILFLRPNADSQSQPEECSSDS